MRSNTREKHLKVARCIVETQGDRDRVMESCEVSSSYVSNIRRMLYVNPSLYGFTREDISWLKPIKQLRNKDRNLTIMQLYDNGMSIETICEKYNISKQNAWTIISEARQYTGTVTDTFPDLTPWIDNNIRTLMKTLQISELNQFLDCSLNSIMDAVMESRQQGSRDSLIKLIEQVYQIRTVRRRKEENRK